MDSNSLGERDGDARLYEAPNELAGPGSALEDSRLFLIDRRVMSHLSRLGQLRDASASLREQAEWCVEIEEAMGGRPPTRSLYQRLIDQEVLVARVRKSQ